MMSKHGIDTSMVLSHGNTQQWSEALKAIPSNHTS
jgi:hypothetical protein